MKHGISPTTSPKLKHGRVIGVYRQQSTKGPTGRTVLLPTNRGRNRAKLGKSGRRKAVAARHASLRARYWEYGETNSSLPSLIYPQWLHPQMRERFEPKREAA